MTGSDSIREDGSASRSRAGAGRMLLLWLVPFAVFAVLGTYSIAGRRNTERVLAGETEQLAVPVVATVHATPLDANSELVLPGSLEAFVSSPIYARTNGYLSKWYRDIGSRVEKGELLAEIDTPEVDQELQQARADLVTAQANLNLSSITAARYEELLKTDSISRQDVDNAKGDLAAKRSILQSAQANLKRLEDLESFKRIYAPFAGVITQRNIDVGTLINAGNGGTSNKELFDLAQMDPLRVFVAVPQSFAPSIRIGRQACLEMTEFPGHSFCGQVARTADAIDPATRTLRTEVDVPNPNGALLPGAYAQVHFGVKQSGAGRLSLPVNALLFRPEGVVAAVIGVNDRIELRRLTIGRDRGADVEVIQGLTAEDSVVLNPPDSLEEGEQVRVKPVTPKP